MSDSLVAVEIITLTTVGSFILIVVFYKLCCSVGKRVDTIRDYDSPYQQLQPVYNGTPEYDVTGRYDVSAERDDVKQLKRHSVRDNTIPRLNLRSISLLRAATVQSQFRRQQSLLSSDKEKFVEQTTKPFAQSSGGSTAVNSEVQSTSVVDVRDVTQQISASATIRAPAAATSGVAASCGEVLVSLCYQPTVERVTVTVVQVKQLKSRDNNKLPSPYTKLWLVCSGKKVVKKKTSIKSKTTEPIYNDSFMFDVSRDKLHETSVLISVVDYDTMGRSECLGYVTLGSTDVDINATGDDVISHWDRMLSRPRQPTVQWHKLAKTD